jgi:hypothetical protein
MKTAIRVWQWALFWLTIAFFQLLLSAAAIAITSDAGFLGNTGAPGEARILPRILQANQPQLTEPQRERPPPPARTASDALLGPESETAVQSTALVPYSGQVTPTSWPGNNGALGYSSQTTLQPGQLVDRFGAPSGYYLSPYGTPFASRSLPPETINSAYSVYEVQIPFSVDQSIVAPAFEAPGLGIQYKPPFRVQDLIDMGYLKQIDEPDPTH